MTKVYSTIIRPIVTEKSSIGQETGQYIFLVSKDATKIDVKRAVKEIYGADAAKVRMIIVPVKTRFVGKGREIKKRKIYKKAIVTLKNNKTIDPNKIKDIKKK